MDEPSIDELPGTDPELRKVLAEAGLPTDDLADPGRRFFRFRLGERPIGYIGWEMADRACVLVRSLVVLPAERGKGAGRAMVDWALTRLGELGATDAYALTTSAEAFLTARGFRRIERAAAPLSVQQSRQFAGICPLSAVLLHKDLP